jgi:nucleoside-diphosphate-sugar epimerase
MSALSIAPVFVAGSSDLLIKSRQPMSDALPSIANEADLESVLTEPSDALIRFIPRVKSPLLVLGAGGKMGPTLAILAKRAAEAAGQNLDVIAVSRFSDRAAREALEEKGVKTIGADLLDRSAVENLPGAENLIYLVGMKFGTSTDPSSTWAMNTVVPARVAERFPGARIVALSTGNVYPLSAVNAGGSNECDALTPFGEYANSAVGRERVFEYFCKRNGTRVAMLRLFYAVELRYGVLVDIAQKVFADEAIDLVSGNFNCIWQGDANEMILRALDLAGSPMAVRNLCRPEIFSTRDAATRFGSLLDREPKFVGNESATALLGNARRICEELGEPPVRLEAMMQWIADWVKRGGRTLGKPTHFETRDGKY